MVEIVTASGYEQLFEVEVPVFAALDVQRARFKVIAHSLPAAVGFDGVLGIDFLRDHLLTIDFRRGLIDLL